MCGFDTEKLLVIAGGIGTARSAIITILAAALTGVEVARAEHA
jgi:hypothetical protein